MKVIPLERILTITPTLQDTAYNNIAALDEHFLANPDEVLAIDKPWGKEVLVQTNPKVQKYLLINPGEILSVQYHEEKAEKLWWVDGEGFYHWGINALETDEDPSQNIKRYPFAHRGELVIPPGQVHTFEGGENSHLILGEISTRDIHDVVRVVDKYGRSS